MKEIKSTIISELDAIIEENEKNFDKKELQSFEKAIKEFEELVNKGLIKKRGYTLITIEEKHLKSAQYSSNY